MFGHKLISCSFNNEICGWEIHADDFLLFQTKDYLLQNQPTKKQISQNWEGHITTKGGTKTAFEEISIWWKCLRWVCHQPTQKISSNYTTICKISDQDGMSWTQKQTGGRSECKDFNLLTRANEENTQKHKALQQRLINSKYIQWHVEDPCRQLGCRLNRKVTTGRGWVVTSGNKQWKQRSGLVQKGNQASTREQSVPLGQKKD